MPSNAEVSFNFSDHEFRSTNRISFVQCFFNKVQCAQEGNTVAPMTEDLSSLATSLCEFVYIPVNHHTHPCTHVLTPYKDESLRVLSSKRVSKPLSLTHFLFTNYLLDLGIILCLQPRFISQTLIYIASTCDNHSACPSACAISCTHEGNSFHVKFRSAL